ncbi:MAG: hypothetical protein V2A54_08595 [Bacteroidota bacterium]
MSFIKKLFAKKWFKIPFFIILVGYALAGFILTTVYFAVRMGITNDPGTVDKNDRYYADLSKKTYTQQTIDTTFGGIKLETDIYTRVKVLNEFYPKNAAFILRAFQKEKNPEIALRMFDALEVHLQSNEKYHQRMEECLAPFKKSGAKPADSNIYRWMNIEEWESLKVALTKEKRMIDSVSVLTGVESRLIVSVVIGEQIRLFNSSREKYKSYLGPLKVLSTSTKMSWGVTGIKDFTAMDIERYLKEPASCYYLGKKYENLLDFKTEDHTQERFDRLTDYHNHFYSYMYAALFLKEVKTQWEKAGYDISNRPEILATLFNLGFIVSKPKADPQVGGSHITVNGRVYTFGVISYEFYYSGELMNEFPYKKKRFWI